MIVAISTVRNEADVIARTVQHLYAEGVDRVIVADNLSTDGTGDLARAAGADVRSDLDPAHRQGEKMTRLARQACDNGATWVLPFDADEVFYADERFSDGTIADALRSAASHVIHAHGWDHIATPDDPRSAHPFLAIRHRRQQWQRLPKVAFRAHPDAVIADGNHSVDRPGTIGGGLLYRHFQYRSLEQMIRKVRQGAHALDLAAASPDTGAHWRRLAEMDDISIGAEWARLCLEPGLVLDPAPVR